MKFLGKTGLITGASRGIGRAIALELADNGFQRLLLVARDATQLAAVATEIEEKGAEAIILPLDLTQLSAMKETISQGWREYGPIDLLVNCAGVAHQSSFLRDPLSQVQEELALNLMGTYAMTRLVARRMSGQQQGTIVNVSSLMGKIAAPTMATYSATKFALLGFTQALRGELSPYHIRVVSLLPPLTDTDMVRGLDWFRWMKPVSANQVAEALVAGLKNNRREILVGWPSHLAVWGQRLAPWLMEKISVMAAPLPQQAKVSAITG